MIKLEVSGIGYLDATTAVEKNDELISELNETRIDLIIDCTSQLLSMSMLQTIKAYQDQIKKCFVLILPVALLDHYPENWNCVPTKTEALDFVTFEQMQRDLGF